MKHQKIILILVVFALANTFTKSLIDNYIPWDKTYDMSKPESEYEPHEVQLNIITKILSEIKNSTEWKDISEFAEKAFNDTSHHTPATGIKGALECAACHMSFDAIQYGILHTQLKDLLLEKVVEIGSKFINATEMQGIANTYINNFVLQFILHSTNSTYQCASRGFCQGFQPLNFSDYYDEIMRDAPQVNRAIPTKSQGTYKVMHFTDIHSDLKYKQGNNAKCNQMFCCREENGYTSNIADQAPKWGVLSSKCDVPIETVYKTIDFAADNLQVDMILYTGDNNDHDFWEAPKNKTKQTAAMQLVSEHLKLKFPSTPIYPMFGNHEDCPIDQYDLYGNSSDYLKEAGYNYWSGFLDQDALDQVKKQGFYSTYNAERNLKIIAIFTPALNTLNFFMMQNPTDPWSQLEWLRSELYEAEANNKSVIIIGHIPTSNPTANSQWGRRFSALVERFTNIIRGTFFGHTHQDQFSIIRSYRTNEPVGVEYIQPSVTTYYMINVFEFDIETNAIINVKHYKMNLLEANDGAEPNWHMTYDFNEMYGIDYMSVENLDAILESFLSDDKTNLQNFLYNYLSQNDPFMSLQSLQQSNQSYFQIYCMGKYAVFQDVKDCVNGFWKLPEVAQMYDLVAYYSENYYVINGNNGVEDIQEEDNQSKTGIMNGITNRIIGTWNSFIAYF